MTIEAKPKPPRVVWEAEVKATAGSVRLVETEKFSQCRSALEKSYTLECANSRDAMGAWMWDVASSNSRCGWEAIKVAIAELGRRCGCEGVKVEVPE